MEAADYSSGIPDVSDQWDGLSVERKDQLRDAWDSFREWVDVNRDQVPSTTYLDNRLMRLYDRILKDLDVRWSTRMVLYLHQREPLEVSTPLGAAVIDRVWHSLFVLDLYRECQFYIQAVENHGVDHPPGATGGPRTPWERRHGLVSGKHRWSFAREQMAVIGFLKSG